MRSRRGALLAVAALVVAVGAIGVAFVRDPGRADASVRATAPSGSTGGDDLDLPPARRADLAKLFDDELRELGYRTTRASLVLRRIYGSPTGGPHLAIYVEPIDPAGVSARASVDTILPVAQVFLPKVFERWSDLASFDVCQEPASSVDDSPAPPPLTQIAVTRPYAKQIDWSDISLDELVDRASMFSDNEEYGLGSSRKLYLYVGPEVADVGIYRRARRAAGLPPTVSTTTSTVPTATSG